MHALDRGMEKKGNDVTPSHTKIQGHLFSIILSSIVPNVVFGWMEGREKGRRGA